MVSYHIKLVAISLFSNKYKKIKINYSYYPSAHMGTRGIVVTSAVRPSVRPLDEKSLAAAATLSTDELTNQKPCSQHSSEKTLAAAATHIKRAEG